MFDSSPDQPNYTITEEQREVARKIAIRRIRERNWRKQIEKSDRPVIIMTEAGAKSWGKMSAQLATSLPHVPIIFENAQAEQIFKTARWSNYQNMQGSIVGHFETVTDYSVSMHDPICDELMKADCVMVFGTPAKELSDALDNHGDYMISHSGYNFENPNPHIPYASAIIDKDRVNQWATWSQQVTSHPSI